MALLLALLMVCVSTLDAQPKRRPTPKKPVETKATLPATWPIEQIIVEGLQNYKTEQVIAATGLKIGQPADKPVFEAARDRLLATGAFDTVGYSFEPTAGNKGYRVTFQVTEIAQLYPYRFDELGVSAEELSGVLRRSDPLFGARIPGTDVLLKRYARVLENYLAQRGSKEKVVGRLTSDVPGELIIVFRPASAPPTVAEVKFTGNSVVPTSTLLNTIAGVAVGIPYSEPRFRQLLDSSIRPLYDARGRLRVSFPKITVERAKDVDGLIVAVEVNEAESYQLGEVTLNGAPQELLKAGDFKTGDLANFDEINAGIERIRRRMRANGYMQVQSSAKRSINDEKKTVDLAVTVEPGPQYVFGKLTIEGLDIHTEPVIRKLWALKEGQPYNNEYPDLFLNRVREQGVFDNLGKTSAKVNVNEQTRAVDVTLRFEGAPPPKKEPFR